MKKVRILKKNSLEALKNPGPFNWQPNELFSLATKPHIKYIGLLLEEILKNCTKVYQEVLCYLEKNKIAPASGTFNALPPKTTALDAIIDYLTEMLVFTKQLCEEHKLPTADFSGVSDLLDVVTRLRNERIEFSRECLRGLSIYREYRDYLQEDMVQIQHVREANDQLIGKKIFSIPHREKKKYKKSYSFSELFDEMQNTINESQIYTYQLSTKRLRTLIKEVNEEIGGEGIIQKKNKGDVKQQSYHACMLPGMRNRVSNDIPAEAVSRILGFEDIGKFYSFLEFIRTKDTLGYKLALKLQQKSKYEKNPDEIPLIDCLRNYHREFKNNNKYAYRFNDRLFYKNFGKRYRFSRINVDDLYKIKNFDYLEYMIEQAEANERKKPRKAKRPTVRKIKTMPR